MQEKCLSDAHDQTAVTLIALGANLSGSAGNPADMVIQAAQELATALAAEPRLSALYRTPAFPPGSGPDFVNAALAFDDLDFSPEEVLEICHSIETRMGRTRHARWGARSLDIDLIAQGEKIRPNPSVLKDWLDLPIEDQMTHTPEHLLLPHPRLQERAFVLVPLADVAADWRHPILGKTVTEMCAALASEDLLGIVPI